MYIFLMLVLVFTGFSYSTDQAFSIVNNNMFDLLAMVPGVILCSYLRGYLFEKLRFKFGDHNGSAKPSKDPIQYIDPYGSICGIAFGFCWPKMPNYYPRNFTKPISDEIYIYSILSITNFAVAALFLVLFIESAHMAVYVPYSVYTVVSAVFIGVVKINIMTGLFSFIPVYGLPGYLLLTRHLHYRTVFNLQKYLSLSILLGLLCLMFGVGHTISNFIIGLALTQTTVVLGIMSILTLIIVYIYQSRTRQKT